MPEVANQDTSELAAIIKKEVAINPQVMKAAERAFEEFRTRYYGTRKILIVGGGEIATEIALAAIQTNWTVRAIVGKDPLQGDEQTTEPPKVPIANLYYYLAHPPKQAKSYTTIEESNPYVSFQFVSGNLHDLPYVASFIIKEEPDIVLLEDVFLSSDEWRNLSSAVLKKLDGKKKVRFIPSTSEKCGPEKINQSEVFLNKTSMKELLAKSVGYEKLLGLLDDGKPVVVDIEKLVPELDDLEKQRKASEMTPEYSHISREMEKYGKIILKPDSTSSGHGQFILSRNSQMNPTALHRCVTSSFDFVKEHRIKNRNWLIEKYLRNKTEVVVILARVGDQEGALINGIYYSKYDMEKYGTGRFRDLTRLESSGTKNTDSDLWKDLNRIAKEVFGALSVPFLLVEFLLDNDHKDKSGKPQVFINEISYRPDDAGFVTLVSHKTDQFKLFMKSLEVFLSYDCTSKIEHATLIELLDTYLCKTLNPEEPITFNKEALSFNFSLSVSQNLMKLRLYEKYLTGKNKTIDHGRIIGYLWHHSSVKDGEVRQAFGALREAFDEKGLSFLKRSLEASSDKIRLKKTVVVSDWEGPWVIADHAYEVVKEGISNGGELFAAISEYDDYLSYIRKKEGYQPGDTLALIAPFLIAHNIDEGFLLKIAKKNANFVTGALEGIKILRGLRYPFRIVSTSYCQYVRYCTSLAKIPSDDVKCTEFHLNKYREEIESKDKQKIEGKICEINSLGKLGINESSKDEDIAPEAKKVILKMDNFFWKYLPTTSFGSILDRVRPLGGLRKYEALMEILREESRNLDNAVVIGDSITDWIMLKKTKDAGGLAIAFNGNGYAIKNATVAVISDNCLLMPILVDLFENTGLAGVKKITENWNLGTLKNEVHQGHLDSKLFKKFQTLSLQAKKQDVYWITGKNLDSVIEQSNKFRKTVRGSAVGALG